MILWNLSFQCVPRDDRVPSGETVELMMELMIYEGLQMDSQGEQAVQIVVEAPTAAATIWMFKPQRKTYRSFNLIRYPADHPHQVQSAEATGGHRTCSVQAAKRLRTVTGPYTSPSDAKNLSRLSDKHGNWQNSSRKRRRCA